MADKLDRFNGDVYGVGVFTRTSDFSADIQLTADASNITTGLQQGVGPRYGMSPILSQSIEAPAISGVLQYGILGSSNPTEVTRQVYGLYRVYGIIPVQLLDQEYIGSAAEAPLKDKTYFFVACGIDAAAGGVVANNQKFLAFVGLGYYAGVANYWGLKSALAYGLSRPFGLLDVAESSIYTYPASARLNTNDSTALRSEVRRLTSIPTTPLNYASIASLRVTGRDEPAEWLIGGATGSPGATTSCGSCIVTYGLPNFFGDRLLKNIKRQYSLFNLSTTVGMVTEFIYDKQPTASELVYTTAGDTNPNLTNSWLSSATAVNPLRGAGGTANFVLWNDAQNTMNTRHTLLLAAAKKPIVFLIQDWLRSSVQDPEQYVDLRNIRMKPPVKLTNVPGGGSRYTESGIGAGGATPKATCWYTWPAFVEGTALGTDAASARNGQIHVTLGAADSGILRKNTVYELTYSIYDKQLGVESNVGIPACIQTSSTDYVALSLYRDRTSAGVYQQEFPHGATASGYVPLDDASITSGAQTSTDVLNYIQIRVYYREKGSFEWLPALFIDAAKYFFYPNHKELWACQGAIAGSVGGQPGGFNDYSEIPDDTYNCVLVWKQRVFWISEKSLLFSPQNNGFAYPVRNAVPVPGGSYKGAIIHNYPGQSEQDSRLVVFGSKDIYVGKFTGIRQQMTVQVSPDDLGSFDVDGSDFELNSWTSFTAFSYRSACVAEGLLYYWGPQGIFRDDGVQTPTRISDCLEPDLFSLYAKRNTDDIHCVYNNQSKEITWFYFDADVYDTYSEATAQTKLLVYNVISEKFYFSLTSACVDASFRIDATPPSNDPFYNSKTYGERTIIIARASKANTGNHQAYFFDYKNRAGDLRYGLERMVTGANATGSSTTTILTLANGTTGISVGDYISTDQIQEYTKNVNSSAAAIVISDFVAKVTAVTSTTITVLLPTNLTRTDSYTLNAIQAFPIYVGKTILSADASAGNAFPYSLESTYWCAGGMDYNAFWKFMHMMFKVSLLKAQGIGSDVGTAIPGFTFSHRTPTSDGYISQVIKFGQVNDETNIWSPTLNSDGNQQIYHMMEPGNENMEGQGIKFKISGLQFAHRWVLQYLAAYASQIKGLDFLKRFEG